VADALFPDNLHIRNINSRGETGWQPISMLFISIWTRSAVFEFQPSPHFRTQARMLDPVPMMCHPYVNSPPSFTPPRNSDLSSLVVQSQHVDDSYQRIASMRDKQQPNTESQIPPLRAIRQYFPTKTQPEESSCDDDQRHGVDGKGASAGITR
jgi:hypothetical protein